MHFEYTGHVHIHTVYSDGSKAHADIAAAALAAGVDFIITTDHNVWVDGVEGYHENDTGRRVLLLVGEEIHDVGRQPQANHCLVFGAGQELSQYGYDPQKLIDAANAAGGFAFLAHPFEIGSPLSQRGELDAINWEDWSVSGYTGLEIWNYMSEFKGHLSGKLAAIRAAYAPQRFIIGPRARTMTKWDELLGEGKRVACIGGGDVHAGTHTLGPLSRKLFPYEFHFSTLNIHILTFKPMAGEFEHDRDLVLGAIRRGNAWIGYDAAADTTGFRFSAQGLKQQAIMGDSLRPRKGSVTFQVTAPAAGHIQLIWNGRVVAEESGTPHLLYQASEPGPYRAQVFRRYAGRKRGWIFSNPIYVEREA